MQYTGPMPLLAAIALSAGSKAHTTLLDRTIIVVQEIWTLDAMLYGVFEIPPDRSVNVTRDFDKSKLPMFLEAAIDGHGEDTSVEDLINGKNWYSV